MLALLGWASFITFTISKTARRIPTQMRWVWPWLMQPSMQAFGLRCSTLLTCTQHSISPNRLRSRSVSPTARLTAGSTGLMHLVKAALTGQWAWRRTVCVQCTRTNWMRSLRTVTAKWCTCMFQSSQQRMLHALPQPARHQRRFLTTLVCLVRLLLRCTQRTSPKPIFLCSVHLEPMFVSAQLPNAIWPTALAPRLLLLRLEHRFHSVPTRTR